MNFALTCIGEEVAVLIPLCLKKIIKFVGLNKVVIDLFVEVVLTCIGEEVEVLTTILSAILLKFVSLHKIRTEILYGYLLYVYG